eukprot:2831661-Rhodomonas_salina.2
MSRTEIGSAAARAQTSSAELESAVLSSIPAIVLRSRDAMSGADTGFVNARPQPRSGRHRGSSSMPDCEVKFAWAVCSVAMLSLTKRVVGLAVLSTVSAQSKRGFCSRSRRSCP